MEKPVNFELGRWLADNQVTELKLSYRTVPSSLPENVIWVMTSASGEIRTAKSTDVQKMVIVNPDSRSVLGLRPRVFDAVRNYVEFLDTRRNEREEYFRLKKKFTEPEDFALKEWLCESRVIGLKVMTTPADDVMWVLLTATKGERAISSRRVRPLVVTIPDCHTVLQPHAAVVREVKAYAALLSENEEEHKKYERLKAKFESDPGTWLISAET